MLVSSLSNDTLMDSLETKLKKQKHHAEKQIRSHLNTLEQLKMKKKNTINLLIEKVILKEEYDEFINVINKQINDLLLKSNQTEASLQTVEDEAVIIKLKKITNCTN
ncbi:hypothetical protein ATL39_2592 [Sinobaca qinghaiensis]|uniref:Uncharacterized protein n=1 Tax=Sinobaca qinghaiensis TaxID=342944 RepID=A0A419UZR1_9BACL|nr:hypothetical protein [Sinobaca qinghaiensis]RKD71196.1 hypothetical protein ATL39_2592 [Sinobaca qinghaiensis]